MYVCCVYTATSYMQYIVKITHKKLKTLEILVEFPIYCLQNDQCSISVSFALHGVPGNYMGLIDV